MTSAPPPASSPDEWTRHPRYGAEVWRLALEARVVLWHGLTGRHAALSAEVAAQIEAGSAAVPGAVRRRLSGLHLLAEDPPPDLRALWPARSRRALLLPAASLLWAPLPMLRTAGGFPFAGRPLTPARVALWRACSGARTLAQILDHTGISEEEARAFFAELTHPHLQALQFRPQPARARDPALLHLVAPPRPASPREAGMYGQGGETTLAGWHLHDITDATHHFDDRETTVSHAFGLPHPALRGQTYGACLRRALEARGMAPPPGGALLEIGPGDGEVGAAWRALGIDDGGEHIRLDIAPALLAAQRVRQPGTREILGSGTAIPLPDASVDLVLCNEVIADLTAVPLDASAPASDSEVWAYIQRYGLEVLPGRALYNLGAWQLIEEVARVLVPGGAAFVTEFGALDEEPEETAHLDHPEVSIRFGPLVRVAQRLGLSAEVVPLWELLGADLQAAWLSRHSYEALRARARAEGWRLPARAWTPESLPLPWPVEGLEWTPITDHGPGPLITRFPALLLRKS